MRRARVRVLPTTRGTRHAGAAGALPTTNELLMTGMCGSHTKRYLPSRKVTVHVTLPVEATVVARFTPGPERWKLCSRDRSLTWIVYAPAGICWTRLPFGNRSEIV